MRLSNLFTLLAGAAAITVGALVPPSGPFMFPLGVGLVGVAVPQVSRILDQMQARARAKKE